MLGDATKMERHCFLCGKVIKGKTTREHIFADSFLTEYDLKRELLNFGAPKPIEYSRLKIPVHPTCNSEMGSNFENYLLKITRSIDTNLEIMKKLHVVNHSVIAGKVKEVLCQWLTKLHLGLIYWELGLQNHPRPTHQASLRHYLETPVLKCLQRCISEWHHFNCPSSLYYFSVPLSPEPALRFDFASNHEIFGTFIRFGPHLLVSTIGDGMLVEEWFGDEQYNIIQRYITEESHKNPLAYLTAVAHIWAVRELLPVQPQLEFTPQSIIDRSREGLEQKPEIDSDGIYVRADEIFEELAQRFRNYTNSAHN